MKKEDFEINFINQIIDKAVGYGMDDCDFKDLTEQINKWMLFNGYDKDYVSVCDNKNRINQFYDHSHTNVYIKKRKKKDPTKINLMNRIVNEAVKHGADSGGSYANNEEDLVKSIEDWLKFEGYNDEYEVIDDVYDKWSNVGIVEKNLMLKLTLSPREKIEQLEQSLEKEKSKNEYLKQRLDHLLSSEFIRRYDEKDPTTTEYVRDIYSLDDKLSRIMGNDKEKKNDL